jgi:hypothetical protein
MGWFLLFVIVAIVAALFLVPALKGLRTRIFGALVTAAGAIVPLATQIAEYLQTLDWRQYILEGGDRKNIIVLAIIGGIGVMIIILRQMTKGPPAPLLGK